MASPQMPLYTPNEKIRQIRQEKFMTIEELAKESGVHFHTLLRAEHGNPVKVSTIRKIAKALDVQPGEIAQL